MVAALFSSILALLEIIVAEEAKQEGRLVGPVAEEVQMLRMELKDIIDVLKDADKNMSTVRIIKRDLIDELTDAAYDSVDVLDEWITTLRINGVGKTSNLKAKVGSYVTHFFNTGQVDTPGELAFKLQKINGSLKVVDIGAVLVGFGVRFMRQYERFFECTSATDVHVSWLIGRDEVMQEIVSSLFYGSTEEQRKPLTTISVVGMGGLGKTTIAEHVFCELTPKRDFDHKIWVCVSDVLDEKNVAKAIIEQLEHVAVDSLDSFPLVTLHERIRRSIEGKKFFLVLDDVWTDDMRHWEALIQTLKHGALGSAILLATRKDTVANMMKDSLVIRLEPLSDEHSWMVFSQTAFCGRGVKECRNLEDIGKRISKKCNGLPLAAKTLGGILRFMLDFFWKKRVYR